MDTPRLINDCFLHDKERLRHHEALAILRANLSPVTDVEKVAADDGLGRILTSTIHAPHDVPLHRNAAVDGYAFAYKSLSTDPLPVTVRIAAGDTNPAALEPSSAARIFTGAVMPNGADSVAMQEDCSLEGEAVRIPMGLKYGANCRHAGEDLKAGDVVVLQGTRLLSSHLAAIASVGCSRISVRKNIRVTLISTGNELRQPGDGGASLVAGEVWDANTPLLRGLLAKLPVKIVQKIHLSDNADSIGKGLKNAAAHSDLVITTGGASRGHEDHMQTVLDALGKRHLWQLAIKPGRPMMFGQISKSDGADTVFLGLPGNPVAAMVCFLLYGREVVLRLAGATPEPLAAFRVPADFEISNKKPDRREFLRGRLLHDENGEVTVAKFERDGSGLISSLTQSDGLIEIDEETTQIKRGDLVRFLPFFAFS